MVEEMMKTEMHAVYLDRGGYRLTCRTPACEASGDNTLLLNVATMSQADWEKAVEAFRQEHPYEKFKFFRGDRPHELAKVAY